MKQIEYRYYRLSSLRREANKEEWFLCHWLPVYLNIHKCNSACPNNPPHKPNIENHQFSEILYQYEDKGDVEALEKVTPVASKHAQARAMLDAMNLN